MGRNKLNGGGHGGSDGYDAASACELVELVLDLSGRCGGNFTLPVLLVFVFLYPPWRIGVDGKEAVVAVAVAVADAGINTLENTGMGISVSVPINRGDGGA